LRRNRQMQPGIVRLVPTRLSVGMHEQILRVRRRDMYPSENGLVAKRLQGSLREKPGRMRPFELTTAIAAKKAAPHFFCKGPGLTFLCPF
jgi:hypothetical protein